jgi:hypothetical protein
MSGGPSHLVDATRTDDARTGARLRGVTRRRVTPPVEKMGFNALILNWILTSMVEMR